ncbi:MAG: hypothetical protein ABJR05_00695 [Balneola sp.]
MVETSLFKSLSIEKVFWALLAGLGLYVCYATYSMRIFYPDGTIYFVHILENLKPVHWHWDRQFAYYVQHFPLISSIKAGITDIPTLARIHTGWYFSFGLLSLLGCFYGLPKDKKIFIIFPLLWMFGIYIQTEFFPITPGRLLSGIYWVVVIQLFFRASWKSIFFIFVIAWCTLRIYQGMMILGPVLVFLSFWRFTRFEDRKSNPLAWTYIALGIYFLAGAILSFMSVLDPQDKTSFITFILGIFLFIDEEGYPSFPLLLGLIGTSFLLFRIFKPSGLGKRAFPISVQILLILLGAFALISPVFWAEAMAPETHQQVRSINIYLCVLLTVPIFFIVSGKMELREKWTKQAKVFVLILGIIQIYWNISATYHWNQYIAILQSTIDKSKPGLVLAQNTNLLNLNDEYKISNGFHNDWDTPLMSILFAPDRSNIKTIIAHSYDNIYHPLNPRDTTLFPDLSNYGVNYDIYFNALDDQGEVSIPDRPIPEFLKWIETQTTGVNDYFEE